MDNQVPAANGGSASAPNGSSDAFVPGVIPPRPTLSAADAAQRAPMPQAETRPTEPLPPYLAAGTGQGDGERTETAERKPRRAGRMAGLLVAAALVGGASGLGGTYAGVQMWAPQATAGDSSPSTITVNNPGSVNEATAVAAEAMPSTVTLSVTSGQESGSGTGVVLTEDGYVVTNTHVVTLGGAAADATIRVTDADGRIYDAEIVGTDPIYDLAVIKLQDAEELTPIDFTDSSKLNVGDTTVAIGAPLGLPNTVTTGVVSALNRSIQIQSSAAPDGDEIEDQEQGRSPWFFDIPGQDESEQQSSGESLSIAVIQTDAAINPGNSGGALVNAKGELIGINVAIATAGGSTSSEAGSVGIGFAIPSNVVERVTDEIIENGSASHGLLGASVTSSALYEDADIEGALIAEVVPGGPADAAGLREGDLVTEFEGVPIRSSTDLTAQVRALAAGAEATLTYVRDGERHEVEVTLGALE